MQDLVFPKRVPALILPLVTNTINQQPLTISNSTKITHLPSCQPRPNSASFLFSICYTLLVCFDTGFSPETDPLEHNRVRIYSFEFCRESLDRDLLPSEFFFSEF